MSSGVGARSRVCVENIDLGAFKVIGVLWNKNVVYKLLNIKHKHIY